MTLNVPLSSRAEASLREKAVAAGQDVAAYVAGLLERLAVEPPKAVREIAGPLSEDFQASGLSDIELGDLLEDAKHRARNERRRP